MNPTPPIELELLQGRFQALFNRERQKAIEVHRGGGFLACRDLRTALRKSRHGDRIDLPEGDFPATTIKKEVEVCALLGGEPVICPEGEEGLLRFSAARQIFSGVCFKGRDENPVRLECVGGVLILDRCVIEGALHIGETGTKTLVILRDCVVRAHGKHPTVSVAGESRLCAMGTGFRGGCEIVLVERGGSARLSRCLLDVAPAPENNGQSPLSPFALQATGAAVEIDGCRVTGAGAGVRLVECPQAFVRNSVFANLAAAALEVSASPEAPGPFGVANTFFLAPEAVNGALVRFDVPAANFSRLNFSTSASDGMSLSGGTFALRHVCFEPSGGTQLQASAGRVEISACDFKGDGNSILFSGEIKANDSRIEGAVEESGVRVDTGSDPRFTRLDDAPESAGRKQADETIDAWMGELRDFIGLRKIKPRIEQILRQAHASYKRKLAGVPSDPPVLRFALSGNLGSGRMLVADYLARALQGLGILEHPEMAEIGMAEISRADGGQISQLAEKLRGRAVLAIPPQLDLSMNGEPVSIARLQMNLIRLTEELRSDSCLMLLANRRHMLRILAQRGLHPFPTFHHLEFEPYLPSQLAAIFSALCREHHIETPPEVQLKLILGFHMMHDRKDRRYANSRGVEEFRRICEARYFERISRLRIFDAPMAPEDIAFPFEAQIRRVMESSPALVSFCPHCNTEASWQPGLPLDIECAGCGQAFRPDWGVWTGSTIYAQLASGEVIPTPEERITNSRKIETFWKD